LHVVDFGVSPLTPSTIGVQQGAISSPIIFQTTAEGSFQSTVSFSCTGLPTGASCNFSPSSQVAPQSNNPVTIALTVTAASATPSGTSSIVVHATTSGAPEKTQTFSLLVGQQDYSLLISNSSMTAIINTPTIFSGTMITTSNFSNPVNLGCGAGAPPSCNISPATGTPSTAGTPYTVTVSSNLPQTYNFGIVAQGTDPLATTHTVSLNFTATFDFSISPNPSSSTVTAGQSAVYNVDLAPQGGSFPAAVAISCSGLPAKTSCSMNPSQLTAGSPETTIAVTVSTSAPAPAAMHVGKMMIAGLWLPAFVLTAFGNASRACRKRLVWLITLTLILVATLSCGGGLQGNGSGGGGGTIQPGTTPGTYIITVTAVAGGSLTHSTTVAFTVQ
jgi:hypothetical protein